MTPASDTTRTGCPRPGCPGHVMVTGFCDTCDEKAPDGSPTVAAPRPGPRHNNLPGQRRPGREQQEQQRPDAPSANPPADELDVDGVVLLPDIPKPRPADVVSTTARTDRQCGGAVSTAAPAPSASVTPTSTRARPRVLPRVRVAVLLQAPTVARRRDRRPLPGRGLSRGRMASARCISPRTPG